MSSSGDVNSNTDEGLRRRKERSLEELERLLSDLKTDADQMYRSTRGVGWSKRVTTYRRHYESIRMHAITMQCIY